MRFIWLVLVCLLASVGSAGAETALPPGAAAAMATMSPQQIQQAVQNAPAGSLPPGIELPGSAVDKAAPPEQTQTLPEEITVDSSSDQQTAQDKQDKQDKQKYASYTFKRQK